MKSYKEKINEIQGRGILDMYIYIYILDDFESYEIAENYTIIKLIVLSYKSIQKTYRASYT